MALFLGDYFARPSKRLRRLDEFGLRSAGHKLDRRHPARSSINVMNFVQGRRWSEPTLLSIDDARTLCSTNSGMACTACFRT